jgi:hypothetical protein
MLGSEKILQQQLEVSQIKGQKVLDTRLWVTSHDCSATSLMGGNDSFSQQELEPSRLDYQEQDKLLWRINRSHC